MQRMKTVLLYNFFGKRQGAKQLYILHILRRKDFICDKIDNLIF